MAIKHISIIMKHHDSPWEIFQDFLSSANFFQNQLFENFFQENHLSVKLIGPRSGPTFCPA